MRLIRLVCLIFGMAAVPALAQQRTATVSGTVVTDNDSPVPDVRISWTQQGQKVSLVTDRSGRFLYTAALSGNHTLTFEHSSTPSPATYKTQFQENSFHDFEILISRSPASGGQSSWTIRERSDSPPVRRPESVISDEDLRLLPNTESLWSFLNMTEQSVVADRFDISGMQSYRQSLLGIRGSSWTQNQTLVDGITVSHPAGEGALVFPDLSVMEAIVYTVGDSASRHTGPGGHFEFLPKTGGPQTHGQARLFFQGSALQGENVIDRYREFGITESDERWKHFVNGGFQLGGPLGISRWNYFTAVSIRDAEKKVRKHPLPVSGTVGQETFNFDGSWSPRSRFAFYGSLQQRREPEADASPQVTREASTRQYQTYRQAQGVWTREMSSGALLEIRLGTVFSNLDSRLQDNVTGQSEEVLFPGYVVDGVFPSFLNSDTELFDMLTNTRRGAAPLVSSFDARNWEGSANYSVSLQSHQIRHRISAGANFLHSSLRQDNDARDGVNLLFFYREPYAVRLLDTPARTRERIRQVELHAVDSVSLPRWSFSFGLAADFSQGASTLSSGQSANALGWNNLGGRAGVAFQVLTRRPLTLRAGLARIYDQPLVNAWTASNPEGMGVRLALWNDGNGDRQFQPGEAGTLLKVSGAPYTTLDPNLRNPVTSEFTVGLTQSGIWKFTFEAFGFRRSTQQLMSLVNTGVPFSSYTAVQATDYGQDAIAFNDDDLPITVFEQDVATLGQDRYFLTNPQGFSSHSEGLELRLRFETRRFQLDTEVTRYRAVAATAPGITARQNDTSALLGIYDDPNKGIFARGSTFFDRGSLARLKATMDLWWKLKASLIGSYQDGLPYGRVTVIEGLNQGVFGVRTVQRGPGEAGSKVGSMTKHYETLDLRLTRAFALRKGRLTASLDVFNIRNLPLSTVESESTSGTEKWRVPVRFLTPRSAQLGLRYDW